MTELDVTNEIATQLRNRSKIIMGNIDRELEKRIDILMEHKDFKYIKKFFDDIYFRRVLYKNFRPFVKRFNDNIYLENFFNYSDAVKLQYPIRDTHKESYPSKVKWIIINNYRSIAQTIGCSIYQPIDNDIPSVIKRVKSEYDVKPYALFDEEQNMNITENIDDILDSVCSNDLTYNCLLLTFYDQVMGVVNGTSEHVSIQGHKIEISQVFGHNYVSWGDYIKMTKEMCERSESRKIREQSEKDFARVNRELDRRNDRLKQQYRDEQNDMPTVLSDMLDRNHRANIDMVNVILSRNRAPYRYNYDGVKFNYERDETDVSPLSGNR